MLTAENRWMSTQEVRTKLGGTPGNTSLCLNKLLKQGDISTKRKLIKTHKGGRYNVYWIKQWKIK